jgi:hypothetical protein
MQTVTLEVVDWNGSRRVALEDMPADLTAGEIIDNEIREAFALGAGATYCLLHNGTKVNRNQSLSELDLEENAELEVAAEVSAG